MPDLEPSRVYKAGPKQWRLHETSAWIRRQLKKSSNLVNAKRAVWRAGTRMLHGSDVRIIEDLPIFTPNSAGSLKYRARLTLQAANQTFPLMGDLVSLLTGKEFAEPVPIESLLDTQGKESAASKLKSLFDNYGSDKANAHDYHLVYGSILSEPDSVTAIIEVGIGTNNGDIVSNMQGEGKPGASLRAFREFLPRARIYGADFDRACLFEEQRIKTFFVDQTAPQPFDLISSAIDGDFDLIIDDGLHSPNANIATLTFALARLKVGGWFVAEDIAPAAVPVWRMISTLLPEKYKSQLIGDRGAFLFTVQKIR
jgi:hypothetical protein